MVRATAIRLVDYEQHRPETVNVVAIGDGTSLLRSFVLFLHAHEVLIDKNKGCIERVAIAWQDLRNIQLTDIPPFLRGGWTDVSERVNRLLAATATPGESAETGEAADIACILLCVETLIRRGPAALQAA